jgi:preprotein translocase subunit SecF
MGAVYRVHDQRERRDVALKRIRAPRSASRDLMTSLLEREYHSLAQLAHPRIVEVYDYGVDLDGAYYTMELLDGQDLRTCGVLPWQQACVVVRDGSDRDYEIRARLGEGAGEGETEAVARAVGGALDAGIGADRYTVERTEAVGPKVGRELQEKALIAILFSFVTTLLYLAFRFEWRFGVAAVLATAHDIVATVAFVRYLNLEVSLVVVAAVLTVVGYSLNDTIVIFDRVRENLRKYRRSDLYGILNLSVNETLPRTVLTGGTTLITAMTLVFLAGEVIKPFALVMSFGIIVGTFSSIYIASPMLLWIEARWPGTDARGARVLRATHDAGTAPAPPGAHPKPTG